MKKTQLPAQFKKASDSGDVRLGVQLARPIAKDLAIGLDNLGIDADIIHITTKLAGDVNGDTQQRAAMDYGDFCRFVYAAYCLGIAVGHVTVPSAFDGGVR